MEKGHIISVVIFTLAMLIFTCIGIFVITALIDRELEIIPKQCNFRDTVDLTKSKRLENGSYLYDGIVIPENETEFYNYTLMFRYTPQPAVKHVRGCICDESKGRFCTKLCCERGEFFNQTSRRCEKLANDVPNEMQIEFMNKTNESVNIFDNFIIQIGKPCEELEVISMKEFPWTLMENGSLIIESEKEKVALSTLNYCISPQYNNESKNHQLTVMSCPIENETNVSLVLNSYSMAVSVVFFGITIVLYLVIDKLHNTFPGKLQTCYLISLTAGYSTIVYINIGRPILPVVPCQAVGFSGYYFFMSAYLWLGVLCFNMYKTVKECGTMNDSTAWTRFIIYSTFVWGTAGIFTLILIWAQLSTVVPERYKPRIGYDMCWLDTHKWIGALYFYIPICIIMILNIIAFVQVIWEIYTVKRNVAMYEANRKTDRQENVFMILRLIVLMGVLWIMDIISYLCREYPSLAYLLDVTDFCNASQGILIFFLFICRREVLKAINEQFHIRKRRPAIRDNQMFLTMQSGNNTTAAAPCRI
ncbi:G-protein coupled receptor Mth2-like [Musca autumnalis]|uniref:G-protein coupled receptor Mth2-like n=1 Tax=Musca autumnalis TaxID=221902 RepID=UPI003CED856D